MASLRMAQMSDDELHKARQILERGYLNAQSLGQKARIDAALAGIEELLVRREQQRLQRRIAQLPARLQTQQALVDELRRIQRSGEWIEEGNVERVVDGDTVLLSDGERVRYLGMDTPELNNGPGKSGVPQFFSQEATRLNAALVEGRRIRMLRDRSERDRHGRLLRYVFCDGEFVNARLVLSGAARLYTLPPDTRFAELLARCEVHAQGRRLGMWRMFDGNGLELS